MAVDSVANQKTIQQIIDQTASAKTTTRNTGNLGKDDFLNLLITQLRYQDPLQPADNTQFIAQMAQFSSLEQMQNMNTSISSTKAFGLIGKYVTANVTDTTTNETKSVSGTVSSVKIDSGKASVVVNGQSIAIENVTEVTDGEAGVTTNLSQSTNLIGYSVDGSVYDSSTGNMVGVSGTVKSLEKGQYDNYAVMDGVKVNISAINSSDQSTTTTANYVQNYLKANEGKAVNVVISDPKSGKKVAVTGTLVKDSMKVGSDGKITATLNDLNVPVESIQTITPKSTDTNSTSSNNGSTT